MAWNGYFAFGGSEIVNTARTEAYLADASVSWFNPVYNSRSVSVIEEETYNSAWADPAPWGDPDNPDTYLFYGAYPLNITGLDDDTRRVTVTENVGDGAHLSLERRGARGVVFELMLSGASECAVETGFGWLKSVLSSAPCNFGCNGTELCYYNCEPCIGDQCSEEDVQACANSHLRTLRNVKCTDGPVVTAKRTATDGSAIWVVTFTVMAGVPYKFGYETLLVEGFMEDGSPWVPDVVPADWAFSVAPVDKADAACAEPTYEPIIDPLCPAVLVPPGPPTVKLGCFEAPNTWKRRWFTIPRKYIPYWGDAVPVIKIQAKKTDVRGLRLRFYSDVDADASVKDDPCSYCGDILFSYIPKDHTIIFDGMTQTVSAEGPGGTLRRADSLVFKTDGTPFEWPVLTCGFGYVVTVDLAPGHIPPLPAVDLSIVGRTA